MFVGERSKPDEAGGERDHLLKALQETQRAYEKLALIGVSLALNVRFTPKSGHQSWLGLRSRSKTGSLALFAALHQGWQLRRTRLQSLLTVNKPTLI